MENKVFLGGTWNGDTWRDELIPMLKIPYFNPVVEDWNEESRAEETRQKDLCGIHLYVITEKMTGVYSIAEAVESAHRDSVVTLFTFYPSSFFSFSQLASLEMVAEMIRKHGGRTMSTPIEHFMSGLGGWVNLISRNY